MSRADRATPQWQDDEARRARASHLTHALLTFADQLQASDSVLAASLRVAAASLLLAVHELRHDQSAAARLVASSVESARRALAAASSSKPPVLASDAADRTHRLRALLFALDDWNSPGGVIVPPRP